LLLEKSATEKQPLAEVFGHVVSDRTAKADRYRSNRLCPFNNKVPNCTKDKANNPLGVCSIIHNGARAITCPVRFREDWLITDDAASFFFPSKTKWTTLTEVRLNDANGKTAGNIDVVLVAYNDNGKLLDFGALEIQAVYISGNVREPFEYFIKNATGRIQMDWSNQPNYPRPDYLSSSRKRLAPQLLFKGGILHSWNKKCAVALDKGFYESLPKLAEVSEEKAEIVWLIYDLELSLTDGQQRYKLTKVNQVFTAFEPALLTITTAVPGRVDDFLQILQERLDEQLESPPSNKTIEKPF
jgi:hypothetical protein